ncbi:zinc finger matrin-type protein 3-like [Oncorhynchus masou masou]|uniref:zinc finger matrin-type protein 3-like n=1 Tax=Oncorhynchus masou masou TaxID=90313 RepID=UPI003183D547
MFGTNEHGAILKQSRAGMKRPRSPGLLENVLLPKAEEEEEDEEEERAAPGRRPKRERRQSSVTLCEVCNIQLNSLAQAQIHYNGKTHQRRLRQFNLAKASNATHTHTDRLADNVTKMMCELRWGLKLSIVVILNCQIAINNDKKLPCGKS